MDDISLTRDLRRRGYNADDVARLLVGGRLTRIRRGGYVGGTAPDTPDDRHRQLLAASIPQLHPDAVVSHGSAALLHGLPVWGRSLQLVHVTRDRTNGARQRAYVQVHGAPIGHDEIVQVAGVWVTSLARTVVDLGRSIPFPQAVAAADRALANGLSPHDVELALRRARRWPGVRAARRVMAFASPLAESPGESVSRVRIDQEGLPEPQLQYEVRNRAGILIGRTDFAWPELGTLGEFDGKVKYGRLLRPGDSASEVVYREKLREDEMRDLSWQLVRWTSRDLSGFRGVADSLRRAFARGVPQPNTPKPD